LPGLCYCAHVQPNTICYAGSNKHHAPSTCYGLRGQPRTETNRHHVRNFIFHQGPTHEKLFIDKTPVIPVARRFFLAVTARRASSSLPTRPRAPRRAASHHPPTASPRRSREPDPSGGDSPASSTMRAPAMLRCAAALAVLLAVAAPAAGFYLPGVAPSDFGKVSWVPGAFLPLPCAHGNGCVTVVVFGAGSGQRGAAPRVGIQDPADQLEGLHVVCSFPDRSSG
jgi:hypothetical protein